LIAVELFAVAWHTSIAQHVRADRLARVYSYDMLGSFVAIHFQIAAGPVATAIGTRNTLLILAILVVLSVLGMLASRDVRRLQVVATTRVAEAAQIEPADGGSSDSPTTKSVTGLKHPSSYRATGRSSGTDSHQRKTVASSGGRGASSVVGPCIVVVGLIPAACNRVDETTGGAALDVRRGFPGVPQCRVGLAPTLLDGPSDLVRRPEAAPRFVCRGWRWRGPRLGRW
jgi:hypothetical protein